MTESYRQLATEFSTADAERPRIYYEDASLVLQFLDWRERTVELRFPSAVAFRWQIESAYNPDLRDDQCYEVLESSWISELHQLGAADPKHRHYKLLFNAAGVLDVISHSLELAAVGEK